MTGGPKDIKTLNYYSGTSPSLSRPLGKNGVGELINAQFPMLNSHPMRIEHWELSIDQFPYPIFPRLPSEGPGAVFGGSFGGVKRLIGFSNQGFEVTSPVVLRYSNTYRHPAGITERCEDV